MNKKLAIIIGCLILLGVLYLVTGGKIMILLFVGGIAYAIYKYN